MINAIVTTEENKEEEEEYFDAVGDIETKDLLSFNVLAEEHKPAFTKIRIQVF